MGSCWALAVEANIISGSKVATVTTIEKRFTVPPPTENGAISPTTLSDNIKYERLQEPAQPKKYQIPQDWIKSGWTLHCDEGGPTRPPGARISQSRRCGPTGSPAPQRHGP